MARIRASSCSGTAADGGVGPWSREAGEGVPTTNASEMSVAKRPFECIPGRPGRKDATSVLLDTSRSRWLDQNLQLPADGGEGVQRELQVAPGVGGRDDGPDARPAVGDCREPDALGE